MRLPGPIEDPPRAGGRPIALIAVVAAAVAGGVFLLTRGGDDTADDDGDDTGQTSAATVAAADASTTALDPGSLDAVDDRVELFNGSMSADVVNEIEVAGRVAGALDAGLVVLTLDAAAPTAAFDISARPCDATGPTTASVSVAAGADLLRQVLVPVAPDGNVCVTTTADADLVVRAAASADRTVISPFPAAVSVVDSTPTGSTADGAFVAIGVRPERSTLRLPVGSRFSGVDQASALVVSVRAVDPLEAGTATVFAAEAEMPGDSVVDYEPGADAAGVALVPIGPTGELCITSTGRTDLAVELLGLVPVDRAAQLPADPTATCPGQTFFPDRRVVALYGTQRSERLGVLGEQDPAAAAGRLEEVAAPWRAGDTPVLPAFELIATLATGTPEDRGVYNLRSSPEFVQEYLDVARRNGFYLILDLQTGQSDFLTEAMYYEEFLRQPDVGLALDPEWRTDPPARPRGGFIGTVDAAEVNEVVEYLARIVEEEGLPEKLLVLHQFEPNMITNRDQIVELPGVAINLHMDGFGPRPEKLNSYEIVKADPPWNMGLKLFYDEDTDLLGADDVLFGGLFDPIPDLITYQ